MRLPTTKHDWFWTLWIIGWSLFALYCLTELVAYAAPPQKPTKECWDVVKMFPAKADRATMEKAAEAAGAYFDLPKGLMSSVIDVENAKWEPARVNPIGIKSGKTLVGSVGLTQTLPESALFVSGNRRPTPKQVEAMAMTLKEYRPNVCFGSRIMRNSMLKAGWEPGEAIDVASSWFTCALVAYNAGDGVCSYANKVRSKFSERRFSLQLNK